VQKKQRSKERPLRDDFVLMPAGRDFVHFCGSGQTPEGSLGPAAS